MMSEQTLALYTFPVGELSCNCSILYSPHTREAIAIDPGCGVESFLEKVKELDVTIKYLLHTHAHFDHIGQADYVRKELGTPIYLHKEDLFLYETLEAQGQFFGATVSRSEGIDKFIEDEEEFGLQIQEPQVSDPRLKNILKSIHTPGHTPGSCSFYTEALDKPVLFSGDTLFARSIGRTDLPGGDFDQIIDSIKNRLLILDPETLVIPGHGMSTTLLQEKKLNRFLKSR